jgi:hypothetical protein
MNERAAIEQAVDKMMNRRYRRESYADIFEQKLSIPEYTDLLKARFQWSSYQAEEVIRMIRILLPTSDDE